MGLLAVVVADTWWQYLLLFLAVAASWAGVPFVGATAAGAAGVAASQGKLNIAIVIVVTTVAGELGGLIGYAIGYRWGERLLSRPGRHLAYRHRMVERGERAYARWGRLAVFVTPAIVSGTARMRHGQFAVWNSLASFGFALSVTASAYGIGGLVSGNHAVRYVLLLVLGIAVMGLSFVIIQRHHRKWKHRPTPT